MAADPAFDRGLPGQCPDVHYLLPETLSLFLVDGITPATTGCINLVGVAIHEIINSYF